MALTEAVERMVKMLVKNPEEVVVKAAAFDSEVEGEPGQIDISLQVHPDDRGRVIGRRGKTINALRTVVKAAAVKDQRRVNIEVLDN